jgi:DNA modification methylase
VTTGWAPSCTCNADVVPCTVLDPFGGSGTTAMVATGHGRAAILCELNPEYVPLIRERCGPMLEAA